MDVECTAWIVGEVFKGTSVRVGRLWSRRLFSCFFASGFICGSWAEAQHWLSGQPSYTTPGSYSRARRGISVLLDTFHFTYLVYMYFADLVSYILVFGGHEA